MGPGHLQWADELAWHSRDTQGWVIDMVSYDAAEVLGASVGVLAIAFNRNNDDVEQFAQIVGGMGLLSPVVARIRCS